MEQILLIFHILISIILIVLILIQRGKGAAMGVAFGSGASSTVFGSRGSGGFLMKITIFLAACFFGTSIALTYIAAHHATRNRQQSFLTNVEQLSKEAKQVQQSVKIPAKNKAKSAVSVKKKRTTKR